MKKYFIFIALLVLIFSIGSVCAEDIGDNSTLDIDDVPVDVDTTILDDCSDDENTDSSSLSATDDSKLEYSDVIVVNNWDELQLYGSKSDKNYIVKLKENTTFYPKDSSKAIYMIEVRNNFTIIGSEGSHIGCSSPNFDKLNYPLIFVPDDSKIGITLENVTFKWAGANYGGDGIFIQMGGNAYNQIKNCRFENMIMNTGHSCIVYLKKGDALLENCSFINCTTDFGVVSVYDPRSVKSARMVIKDSYFENNYARTEPGCINNCAITSVYNTTFVKNRSVWWAGAIHTHSGANTTIYNSKFINNVAGWNGGALYTYSYLQIYNSTFIGNNCTTNSGGGAIGACNYNSAPHIYIENSLFENNVNTDSNGMGGAIAVMDKGDFEVHNSTFIHNNAARGTAIFATAQDGYGSPNVIISNNQFINHNRLGDVIIVNTDGTGYQVTNNTFINNIIPFSTFTLNPIEVTDKKAVLNIDVRLSHPSYYDSDILDKCNYDVYVDGVYEKTVKGRQFSLDFEDIDSFKVYVVPSISILKSNEITIYSQREFIYVSKSRGDDLNNGLSEETPVYSISKAIELARETEHIILLDGGFYEQNLNVNSRLTIWGSEDSSISGSTFTNTMFNVNNVKFSLRNMTITNLSSDSSSLIKENNGKVFIENCIIKSNNIDKLVDSTNLEIKNTLLENNKLSIYTNTLKIENTTINNNDLSFNSKQIGNWEIANSKFTNNRNTLINYAISDTLTISDSIFNKNNAENTASCIFIDANGKLNISSSIFINNDENLPVVYKNTENSKIKIRDSILLNNSINNPNGVISGKLNNIDCNYNWWGNTFENTTVLPNVNPEIIENWLYLNATYTKSLEYNVTTPIEISLNNVITKSNSQFSYDSNLPTITLTLTPNNGIVNDRLVNLTKGKAIVYFTLDTTDDGGLLVNYECIELPITFTFVKTNPKRTITAKDIMVGDNAIITVKLPNGATGNITIQIGNITESQQLVTREVSFNIGGMEAKTYNLIVNYTGDNRYTAFSDNFNFTVKKYASTTRIVLGKIKVNDDLIITAEVPTDATGYVTFIINGEEHNSEIVNSKATYTIESISRGDWEIKAIYNGNSKYAPSEDTVNIEVGKSDARVIINVLDISYGEDAEIQIRFEQNDVTGNVTVIIDDSNKTGTLVNARTKIVMSNLTAGHKIGQIKYTGDKYYNSATYPIEFNIAQIPMTFNITATSVKEGQNVLVELTVVSGIDGNFTIKLGDIILDEVPIPLTGEVTSEISTLPVGNHTLTAVYHGQNYMTCEKTVNVTVYPWKGSQWPNEGFDGSGKSPYTSDANGNLSWLVETAQISGNILIDSEGNVYIITANGIESYDKNGKSRWNCSLGYTNKFSGMSIGREVIVAPVSGDTLYFINQTSGERISSIYQGSSVFAPVIDSKFNVYVSGEEIYETGDYNLVVIPYSSWNGGALISINLGKSKPTTSPVVVNDHIVCIGTENGLKFADISQEAVISTLNIVTGVRPVVGDGEIVYTLTSDEIIAITSAGNILWKSNIKGGEAKHLAIDKDNGALYSINTEGNLYMYDIFDSGAETLISTLNITSGILIGNDGTLYVASDAMFIAIDYYGEYLWKSDLESTISGTPIMDESGVIYVTGNNTLFALTNAPLKEAALNINVENVEYGEDVKITVNMNKEVTGEISLNIKGKAYSCKIYDGLAEISVPNLTASNYNVDLRYSGDKRYSEIVKLVSFNVTKKESSASVISIPSEVSANNPIFSIELPNDATGTLTVSVDGKEYSQKLVDGKATVEIPKLSSGSHKITVNYSGDENYASITTTKTVTVPSPKLTDNINIVMDYNDGSVYKVRVIGSDGNIVVGDYVTFKINGKTNIIKTDKNGYASLKITETPKTYTITATYKETTVKNTITVKQILKSKNFKVKKSAKKLVLKATLKSSKGKALKGKQIVFKFNGKTYKVKTNKKGVAKVTIKKNVIKKLKTKKYALQITYLKDTIKKTVTVKK